MAVKLSITKVENALREHDGVILKAAAACGVHRHTLKKFLDKHPQLEAIRDECNEALLDIADSHIVTAIKMGDMKTIRWHQERRGKDRGYSTRVESTGANGTPLQLQTVSRRIVDAEGQDADDA